MAVLQLVVREAPEPQLRVTAVENPRQLPPELFDTESQHAFLLGSDDLLVLAFLLSKDKSYRLVDVDFVGRDFEPLDQEDSESLRSDLRSLLGSGNLADLLKFSKERMVGIYVSQVQIRDRETSDVYTLAQDGIITGQSSFNKLAQNISNSVSDWQI